jgi:Calcium-binding EGF domain
VFCLFQSCDSISLCLISASVEYAHLTSYKVCRSTLHCSSPARVVGSIWARLVIGANEVCDTRAKVCVCTSGFRRIDEQCVDVDECSSGPCGSGRTCTNTNGSFTCTSPDQQPTTNSSGFGPCPLGFRRYAVLPSTTRAEVGLTNARDPLLFLRESKMDLSGVLDSLAEPQKISCPNVAEALLSLTIPVVPKAQD